MNESELKYIFVGSDEQLDAMEAALREPIVKNAVNPFHAHLKNCDACSVICGTHGKPLPPQFSGYLCSEGQFAFYQQPEYNKPETSSQRVVCSCGRTCMLTKRRVNDPWRPDLGSWKFRSRASEDGHLGLGWYCGEAGHEQVTPENYNGAEVFLR